MIRHNNMRFCQGCFAAAMLGGVTSAMLGCSRSAYELAPVAGTVTIDGEPLSSAKVMFAPLEVGDNPNPGRPAFGLVQDNGSFVLTTYKPNDGAVVGEHWVTIIRLIAKREPTTLVSTSRGAPQFDRLSLPQKVTIVADTDNQIDLKLTSRDVSQYGVVLRD